MKPAFEEHRIDQALAKISDVMHHPSGGYGAPSWAETYSQQIVQALEELERRMRAHHMNLQHGSFPIAIYAARELNKFLQGASGDIANKDAAEVYYRCLADVVNELRPMDKQLVNEEAA